MTIYDDLKQYKGYKKHMGTYGIEIETETEEGYIVPVFKYWIHDEDHSLRNFGIEYMLKAPLAWPKEVDDALLEFEQKTNHIPFDKESNSTSVHTHMNMLNEEWLTLASIFTVYALFENLLIRWSGPARRSNLFCLPICDAEQQFEDIVSVLKSIKAGKFMAIWNFEEKTNKYAALNFVPLTIHGSIEFRSFRGDPSRECIKQWIDMLDRILQYARGTTPDKIIDAYRHDKNQLVNDVFGLAIAQLLFDEARKQGDDPEKLISQNFWYAASIALWNKDWTDFGKIEKPKAKVDKNFDKFCMDNFGKPSDLLDPETLDVAKIVYHNNGGNIGVAVKANKVGQGNLAGDVQFFKAAQLHPAPIAWDPEPEFPLQDFEG